MHVSHGMRSVLITCTAMVLTAMSATMLVAQNESGRRALPKDRIQAQQIWLDSSTAMFQTAYPIIRSIPPLSTLMPFDVLLSYIYTDSLLRFDVSHEALNRIHAWKSYNDTLRRLAKYLYLMTDYNPATFSQYKSETLLHTERYKNNPYSLKGSVQDRILNLFPDREESAAMYALVRCDYILRVKVIDIDSMPMKIRNPILTQRVRATALVLDTLKGHAFQSCISQSSPELKGHSSRISGAGGSGCIDFQYVSQNYFDPLSEDDGPMARLPFVRDPTFTQSDGGFHMEIGQEAIVFVEMGNYKLDSTFDYYDLDLIPAASYNALPIINGKVRDVNHVWSPDDYIEYDVWKQRFIALRQTLLH